MSDFDHLKALAFDHQGTLFDKHAVGGLIDESSPGHGEAIARAWFETIKQYCWLSGLMERHLTWAELTDRALTYCVRAAGFDLDAALHAKLMDADLHLPPFPDVPMPWPVCPRVSISMFSAWPRLRSSRNPNATPALMATSRR